MYDIIIGLEIHAGLKTKSKMFCSCANETSAEANTNVCPICLGHPGTLPTVNKEAVEKTILLGLALDCTINQHSKFDRKNYFYPDLPKGYQISQYDIPFCEGGSLEVNDKKIAITRIHLEEDTGRLSHPALSDDSLVDFNRAGTPLLELVTEPIIPDPATAKAFGQRYQQVLRYFNISTADMEKGEMRCEGNISLQTKGSWKYKNGQIIPVGKAKLNAKVELKNINSFRSLERALEFEIKRQSIALDKGETILPETRGWNDQKSETVRQRVKETSADYRYFPEPDLPPVVITNSWLKDIKARMVELPWKTESRLRAEYGLSEYDAMVVALDKNLLSFTEDVISELQAWVKTKGDNWERQRVILSKLAVNWIINELSKNLNEKNQSAKDLKLTAENLAEFILMVHQGKINSSAAQKILSVMMNKGGEPTSIMNSLGLAQIDDKTALKEIIKKIISAKPDQVELYKKGKVTVIQFFIGQVMAASKGAANPAVVKELLEEELKK
ncbi:MAG: Asp-tRNA(Asn)/Glu-tRNA(Gln) amidotransferase subunit GatB [Candidatus Falkowbacteria bacterium]|nr:Asp-tRNA(Asn)/Glu-tRNA(Gln) amidotransferase subunit GatB [Candidatus Falkowbacteria bacterium]